MKLTQVVNEYKKISEFSLGKIEMKIEERTGLSVEDTGIRNKEEDEILNTQWMITEHFITQVVIKDFQKVMVFEWLSRLVPKREGKTNQENTQGLRTYQNTLGTAEIYKTINGKLCIQIIFHIPHFIIHLF